MSDELVTVSIFTKTGHETEFSASAFQRVPGGYEFISYPERRGFKRLRRVYDEALASISIEAPEPFFDAMKPEPAADRPTVPVATGSMSDYVNPIAQRLKDPKANISTPVPDTDGRPLSVISEYGKDGQQRKVPVGAGMVKM